MIRVLERLHILYAEVEHASSLVTSMMEELAGYEPLLGRAEPELASNEEFLRAYV